ncbi:hypothetical protein M422DRAFT_252194 [Sphaerobolus stellatus SS14]|uniref:Uncharacterized protein n=1 Tax=Sphaerobolus stellatus (strain SS14) TaxID=990650 RepID=A0A0C9W0X9_SPHS4|nr:hypothetical protein M422DRAFT_252194 [Sphaerobolus stellatus SS14]
MSPSSLNLKLERLLVPETYEVNPHTVELSINDWDAWFKQQQQKATWRLKSQRNPTENGRSKVAWRQIWEYDHAGRPRDRRKLGVSPKNRRARNTSIKVGCTAKIHVSQPVGSEKVKVVYDWEHTGHDAFSLDDMRSSRNPDIVRAWLDQKVSDGFDQKAIKAFIRMAPEELSEITPDADAAPYSIKISPMDIYNAIRRKADIDTRLAPKLNESIEEWLKKLNAAGWSTLYKLTPSKKIRDGFTLALTSPWQKEYALFLQISVIDANLRLLSADTSIWGYGLFGLNS